MLALLLFIGITTAYTTNELTALEYIGYLVAPNPAEIVNDYNSGTRHSGIWDILAQDVQSYYSFGDNKFYGKEQVAVGHVGHELSGYNQLSDQIIKSITSDDDSTSLWYETVQLHPGGYNYTSTSVLRFKFKANGKIHKIIYGTWNIEWNLGPLANPANSINTACSYATNFCNSTYDPEGYFRSLADCQQFMGTIPVGTWGYLARNSVSCRIWNGAWARVLPHLFCRGLGRTGGQQCFDRPSSTAYPNQFY